MSALSEALNAANVEGWSAREIARRSDDRIHHATVAKYLNGTHGRPSEEMLVPLAEVLRIKLTELRKLAGLPAGEVEPYQAPPEADRLDKRQRRVVNELIRLLAERTTEEGEGNADRPPSIATAQEAKKAAQQRIARGAERQDQAAYEGDKT